MPRQPGEPPPCPFCAIVAGDLAAEVVHDDEACIAFLDHRPLFHGHTLLAPREHVATLADLPQPLAGPLMLVWQRLQRAVEAATGADGSLLLVNNVVSQSVPHLHLHVIPRRFKDGLRFWLGPRVRYGGDAPSAAAMAAAIRAALATG
ncbi:MAG: HIT family protein [Frankiaceae bacterium]